MKHKCEHGLYAQLHPDARAKLPFLMKEKYFAAGEQIYAQDEPDSTFNILIEGRVKTIRVRPDGREVTLCTPRPGDSFCVLSTMVGCPQVGSAYATTDVKLLRANRSQFFEICKEFPQLHSLVGQACLKDMLRHIVRFELATFATVEERLAQILLEQSQLDENIGESPSELFLSQQDMANLAGTSRESVSRVLSKWKGEGLIDHKRGRVFILDFDELKSHCFSQQ